MKLYKYPYKYIALRLITFNYSTKTHLCLTYLSYYHCFMERRLKTTVLNVVRCTGIKRRVFTSHVCIGWELRSHLYSVVYCSFNLAVINDNDYIITVRVPYYEFNLQIILNLFLTVPIFTNRY